MTQVRVSPLADYSLAVWLQAALLLGLLPGLGLALWAARGCGFPPPGFLIFAAALAAGAAACLALAARRALALLRLGRRGVAVRAAVRRWDAKNARWGTGWISLEYTHAGKTYTPSLGMCVGQGQAAAARGWLPVVIDPGDPATFAVAESDD